jgi:excisionase family DNA binding protein
VLPERLLSVRAVADLLGVSRATVYALVERGELPRERISNVLRFDPADVSAFIKRSRSYLQTRREVLAVESPALPSEHHR